MWGIGIIGAGSYGAQHAQALADLDTVHLVAASRTNETALREFTKSYGGRAYTDYGDLLQDNDVDVVVIATPHHLHTDIAIAAAQAGKHILLEKAMATNVEDARAIRDAVEEAGVKSAVSFVLRWNPLFDIIRQQLADDAIGRVFMGEVDYFHGIGPWYGQFGWNIKKEVGGSSLLSAGCHALDAPRYFMGGNIS